VSFNGSTGVGTPYTATIVIPMGPNFPNGAPKVAPGHQATTYLVTVELTCKDMANGPGVMAAREDLGKVTFYL